MNTEQATAALVGATGGAGTTRVTVEMAATLARAGHEVAVLDAAFGTQGLADHVDGRIGVDLTGVLIGEHALESALYPLDVDAAGGIAVAPARCPFERLARAKTASAATRFEETIQRAAESFTVVLVDTPPVAANQAVAAVNTADRVGIVAPGTPRGRDAVARLRARLADVGTAADTVIATRPAETNPLADDAAATIPEYDRLRPGEPVCTAGTETFGPAVAGATETLLATTLDLSFPDPGLLG